MKYDFDEMEELAANIEDFLSHYAFIAKKIDQLNIKTPKADAAMQRMSLVKSRLDKVLDNRHNKMIRRMEEEREERLKDDIRCALEDLSTTAQKRNPKRIDVTEKLMSYLAKREVQASEVIEKARSLGIPHDFNGCGDGYILSVT